MHRAQALKLLSKIAVVLMLVGVAAPSAAAPPGKGGAPDSKGAAPAPAPAAPGRQNQKKAGTPDVAQGKQPSGPNGDTPTPDPAAVEKADEKRKVFQKACLGAYRPPVGAGAPASAATPPGRAARLQEVEKARVDAENERQSAHSSAPELTTCNLAVAKSICTGALTGEVDLQLEDEDVRTCLKVNAGLTAGVAGVGADIVQSIAQVVVNKAQAAAWGLLISKIREIAHCAEPQTKFPKSCDVLSSLSIKDLVSSPGVLLNAVVADLMVQFTDARTKDPVTTDVLIGGAGILGLALLDGSARWEQAGAPGFVTAIRSTVLKRITEQATASCDQTSDTVKKYTYVVGVCLAQGTIDNLPKCSAGDFIKLCGGNADASAELSRLWDLTTAALDAHAKPVDVLNLGFALGNDEIKAMADGPKKDKAKSYFSGTKDLVMGLVNKDWVEATSGGVRIVTTLQASLGPDPASCKEDDPNPTAAAACKQAKAVDPDRCDPKTDDCQAARSKAALRVTLKDEVELLGILAPVGNYALTFDKNTNSDPATAANAREKIIEELVDRMVNRTDRKSGAVLSLGGSLGLIGGPRFASTDKLRAEVAFPVQLELGLGLQTYASKTGGFHLMVSVLDLGQYVNMNGSGELKVGTPDLSSAVEFGATVGGWVALRETPWYLGAHASVAPFNQADGNPTFQAGVVTGVYVPLLDFN